MQTSIPLCDAQRTYAEARARAAMMTLTDNLDQFPPEMIDTLDENGIPISGSGGLTCLIVEANGEDLCE